MTSSRAALRLLFAPCAAAALALALGAAAPAAAGELSREELFGAIQDLRARRGEEARVRALADEYLARFGEADPNAALVLFYGGEAALLLGDAPAAARAFRRALAREPDPRFARKARHFLGLALAEAGRDEEAESELGRVASDAGAPAPLAAEALYAIGQIRIARGDASGACQALAAARARAPGETSLLRRIEADLRDLAKIGAPAPPLAGLSAGAAPAATVVVFERRGAELRNLELPAGVALLRVTVGDWDDPRLRDWAVPALPRIYVIDGAGIVRAAGLKPAAVAAAVQGIAAAQSRESR